jgi:hypothetical protein
MFCPHCGNELAEIQAFCHHCGARLAEPGPAVFSGRNKTPWEDRESVGFFTGLSRTVKETLFSPSDFFKRMPVTGGLTDPLVYALIVGMTGLMFFYFWDIVLRDSMRNFMSAELLAASEQNVFRNLGVSLAAVMTPFFLIFWLFVASGLLHLVLLAVRGARAGYEATFRVVGYSVSPFVLLAVPVCGAPLTALWVMTIAVIGLREAHETSGGKAAFAVLFPFLLCCGLFVLAILLFMGAVAASFGSMMHLYR